VAFMSDQQPEQDKRVFPPPDKPVECSCLHCGRIYTSDMMIEVEIDGEYHYVCPVKGCTAMGWNFDIFSTTEDDSENGGWVYYDDEDEFDEEAFGGEELEASERTGLAEGETAAIPFDPPRDWSPEADAEDDDDEPLSEEFEEDEEFALRGTMFTREEYEQLKSAGEYDQKIEEIREQWRSNPASRPIDPNRPITDDDIPF
jgi:hypothetical protein